MISVIIPTLDQASKLDRALQPLVAASMGGLVKQVIVADAGSSDDTLALAEAAGCEIVRSAPGRAKQMRAGAAAAKGKWLLFLHADTVLCDGWIAEVAAFLQQPQARKRAAAFRLNFPDSSAAARRAAQLARLRAQVMKLPYGDQCLLISRYLYDAVGGYPDIPAMEDVEIIRRIGQHRLILLKTEAVSSAEHHRRGGYDKRAWRNIVLMTRYLMGADPVELAKAE
ncbi:TIGR04283 family arsenosugar biosynthesis glycosyltransferase [Terricaulis sp.]|uniref:TIGR04283 family arsenosugar biosynthesis glycosyltransferase n=1 Tax=Terricaulis sp. TaxID=2768686 RepID=UPI0037835CCB